MPRLTLAEINQRLEPLREEMIYGLSDSEVSERTGVSVRTVQRWRLVRGIKHLDKRGHPPDPLAINAFGNILDDIKQRASKSSVGGGWVPPTYVTRVALDYDLFLQVLYSAHHIQGLREDDLMGALGMSAHSISQGLQILDGLLSRKGIKCSGCGNMCLPRPSGYCSKLCEEMNG